MQKNNIWLIAMVIVFAVSAVCVAGFILVDRLTSAPPKVQSSALAASQPPAAPIGGGASQNVSVLSDQDIIGLWSSEGASGELVDPATGFVSGSVYNGEWYLFREDGTFRYVIVSSGQVLSGGIVWEGRFSVKNGEIKLTGIKESWYPNPAATGQKEAYDNKKVGDTALEYRYGDDANTLVINGADHFTRVLD